MKVDRKDLKWFLDNIRRTADRDKIELTDEILVDELANYMETNPGCVNINGVSNPGRYYYSTVGYGIFSLLGEKYRMGRIEIFDKQNDSGYQIDEGTFCMPFVASNQFEDFINSLETDLPINIEIGSMKQCQQAVSEELGIPVEKLNDEETKKLFYKKKNDIFAQEQGFKDWDDYLESTVFGQKSQENKK